jgi:hypothetical protein
MSALLTADEIGPLFRVTGKTIRQWRINGKITAEINTGHTVLFDPERVRRQLTRASRKPAGRPLKGSDMVPTI